MIEYSTVRSELRSQKHLHVHICFGVFSSFSMILSCKDISSLNLTLHKKATIHQVTTTVLATFNNVLFPGHNHLLTTGADDPTL